MSQSFSFKLVLEQDCIEIIVTNQSVDFIKLNSEAIIRPRHISLANEIITIIKEKGK